MLPAQQGDALWMEYGSGAFTHRIVFDAGTAPTWTALRAHLSALPSDGRHVELLVVSHVDSDHIAGSVPLLRDESLGVEFGDIWFNAWRHLPGSALEPMGPVDGEILTGLLATRRWNTAWGGDSVVVPEAGKLPTHTLPGGMKLTLLSPGLEQLRLLRPVWEDVIREAGLTPGVPPAETPQIPDLLEALGPDDIPDIYDLANTSFRQDTAEANGSSIAVLAEYDGSSVILAADAHPDVLLRSVGRLLSERGEARLRVDAFKLPHHGSKRNVSRDLLAALETDNFLFSTDGSRTHHPNPEAIARVLVEHPHPRLWFNYRSRYSQIWGRDDVLAQYAHAVTFPRNHAAGLVVDL